MSIPTLEQKIAMRDIILLQCAGMISYLIFQNGFLLAYFTKLGFSGSEVLFLLSIPQIVLFVSILPSAFYSDRYGKKKIGLYGTIVVVIGMVGLTLFGFWGFNQYYWVVFVLISVLGLGESLFNSSWFALLKPIIPIDIRGRFFGLLRSSWQIVTIVFTFIVTQFFIVRK